MHNFALVKTYHTLKVVDSFIETALYEDETMMVQTVLLHKPQIQPITDLQESKKGQIDEEGEEEIWLTEENTDAATVTESFRKSSTEIPYSDIETMVASYVCYIKPKRGALLMEKCTDYGVPAGPLLRKLKNG